MSPACTAGRIAFPRLKKPWKCAVPLVFPALYNTIAILLYWFIILFVSFHIFLLPYCIELIICSTFSLPPHLHTPLPFYISPVFPLFYGFIVLFVYVSIIIFSFIYIFILQAVRSHHSSSLSPFYGHAASGVLSCYSFPNQQIRTYFITKLRYSYPDSHAAYPVSFCTMPGSGSDRSERIHPCQLIQAH